MQLEGPLAAPTLHVVRVIVGAVTSIGINIRRPRADVFWTVQQRGMTCGLISQVRQRLDTCVVRLGEEEIVRVLAESNE